MGQLFIRPFAAVQAANRRPVRARQGALEDIQRADPAQLRPPAATRATAHNGSANKGNVRTA